MSSRKRRLRRVDSATGGRVTRPIVCLAVVCLALSGCSFLRYPLWRSGNRRGTVPKSYIQSEADKEEGSWFGSWFGSEEPRPSKTVDDFLGMPRPEA
ncbi:MAG: hypothetical protein ACYTG0_43050 [Planctomycetota bacterium]